MNILAIGVVLATSLVVAAQAGWQAKPEVVQRHTKQRPQFNYDEAAIKPFELPDALATAKGPVRTSREWTRRRAEILELFRTQVYGRRPGKPQQLRFDTIEEKPAMDGAATLKRIAVRSTHEGRKHEFELRLFLPTGTRGRAPLFLLMNNRAATITDPTRASRSPFWPAEEMIARGYAIAALQVADLAPDDRERYRDGVIRLFEGETTGDRPGDAWAALAAWGWGASRAMDYFETDSRIDARRVAVVGHSRGGKAALWAGAEDERFAIVISNESGEGGASLTRRNFGETLGRITESFPHWFAAKYKSFAGREETLPIDQHLLLGLIAPRAVYVASADEDLWSDPRGEFLALAHASPVFALWGDPAVKPDALPPLERPLVAGRRGYHVRAGGHDLTVYDWQRFADFADAIWKRMTGASVVPASVDTQRVEDGFTSLFNGTDLTGWVYGRRKGAEHKSGKGYQVENGVLYSTKEDGGNLYTEKEYSDFVFRFEFRLTENANNGIGIRAPLEGDAAYAAIEIQVLDDSGSQYLNLKPAQYHGSVYGVVPAKRGFQKPVGEWNTQEITVRGRHITVVLNGTTIVDANLDDVKDPEILKPRPGLMNHKGHIGFLGHGTRVEFRNIRVREL